MPSPAAERYTQELRKLLAGWDGYAEKIDEVRKQEQPAPITPTADLEKGYRKLSAQEGYQQLVDAYRFLDDTLTGEQKAGLEKVSGVLRGLRQDQLFLEDTFFEAFIKDYPDTKKRELVQRGEIYMPSGYKSHFSIIKMAKTPKGGHSFTRYDAGTKSQTVARDGAKEVVNTVDEREINPGADLAWLVKANAAQINLPYEDPAYGRLSAGIESSLGTRMRAERGHKQDKGNCTTRSQRILITDILQDDGLSANIRDFITNNTLATVDIKAALGQKLSELERTGAQTSDGKKDWKTRISSAGGGIFASRMDTRGH